MKLTASAFAVLALIPSFSFAMEEIHWSPQLTVGLPQPLQLGVQASCVGAERYCFDALKFYTNTGYFSTGLGNGKAINLFNFEAGSRIYPLSVPVFAGLGLGYRKVNLSADMSSFKIDDESLASSANMALSTFYLTPSIGFDVAVNSRLSIGLDLGVQLPLSSSGEMVLYDQATGTSSKDSETLKVDSEKAMGRMAGFILPKLALLRFTWALN